MVFRLHLVAGAGCLPIRLGATRLATRQQMSDMGLDLGTSRGSIDYYFNNVIQVEFDTKESAIFIGVAASRNVELLYSGKNLIDLPARVVFDLIAANERDQVPAYTTSSVLFPGQIITLWEADPQYDSRYGKIAQWGQIGIGNAEYLAALSPRKSSSRAISR